MARISGLEKKPAPWHLRWSYRAVSATSSSRAMRSVPGAVATGLSSDGLDHGVD